jgi:hypothetical protein
MHILIGIAGSGRAVTGAIGRAGRDDLSSVALAKEEGPAKSASFASPCPL